MLLMLLIIIATALTCAMFATKQMMLGFPCVIFWAIAGGQAYETSTALWDIYYFVFIACVLGMTIFCSLAMYGLRDKKKTLGEEEESNKYFDEGRSETEQKIDKSEQVNESSKDDNDMFSMESNNHKDTQISKGIHRRLKERREGKRTGLNISR